MFKVDNKDVNCVFLVSFLLTLNILSFTILAKRFHQSCLTRSEERRRVVLGYFSLYLTGQVVTG